MIEISVLLIAFLAGLCTGVVLFIVLGYILVKKGQISKLFKP